MEVLSVMLVMEVTLQEVLVEVEDKISQEQEQVAMLVLMLQDLTEVLVVMEVL